MKYLICFVVLVLSAVPVTGQTPAADNNGKLIRIDHEIVVSAPISKVWAALTTPEGLRGWVAPEAKVELFLGGAYELYFRPNDEEDRGMEGTRVISLVPGEMLSYTGEIPGTWVVWRLDRLDNGRTRIRFSGLGSGSEWEKRHRYFDNGTTEVLQRLSKSVTSASSN